MNIVIATGIYPPKIGGPAEYAFNFQQELVQRGHKVSVLSYGIEDRLPIGIRHLYYFFRLSIKAVDADVIYAFDTWSVGLPSLLASLFFHVPLIVRIGGDFLWESYVERTGEKIPLSVFYTTTPKFNYKEQFIFLCTKMLLRWADTIAFTTEWQRDIWAQPYGFQGQKGIIIENYFPEKSMATAPEKLNFLWAVRPIKLKNGDILQAAFQRLQNEYPNVVLDMSRSSHEELLQRMASCYAVVLPSISEVCPNFIIDAVRYNKPFLCTGDTGLYAKFLDIGIFVDPLNQDSVYEGLKKLADPIQYAQYLSKVASFTHTHSWQQITDELLEAYHKNKKR